jgi:TRAP-type mannitol/chloroaromatic compound transport system permease small subunit
MRHKEIQRQRKREVDKLTWQDVLGEILFLFLFCIVVLVLGGDTLWHLQRFLKCIKYIILEFPPSLLSFTSLPQFLEQFQ